ncbi:hypothetical protein [Natronoglycomyces albus]|uniref:Uncharacterized protein n=1 Tax=Natronoglycomyces albus TaxID=2811108 RepID=A0A895XPX8_9ACTN|nr:hypothetical protein [Natronoglycomyces albus]QSB04330.1 hypothetical protein JQS30_11040 [Natronoglycomyces albus]
MPTRDEVAAQLTQMLAKTLLDPLETWTDDHLELVRLQGHALTEVTRGPTGCSAPTARP